MNINLKVPCRISLKFHVKFNLRVHWGVLNGY
jgi:hypothetical protein